MNLPQFFSHIGTQLGLNADVLMRFAEEDKIGGFNHDPNTRRWPMGSMWEVEGKALYALIRAMKPRAVLEIGTWVGCSATHILEALAVNGKGRLVSIDTNGQSGDQIPLSLRKRWKLLEGRAEDVIPTVALTDIDLVFEDGPHGLENTAAILDAMRKHLAPSLIISHDGAHFLVGANIREAYRRTFGQPPEAILIEPSDCGFAYWVPQP